MQIGDLAEGALQGLRVIDLGRLVAGPVLATFLAEQGAEVIKVEPLEGGDQMRAVGVAVHPGCSATWLVEGRNKKSIALNLQVQEGKDVLEQLVQCADVLVENSRPGWLEGLGLPESKLREINPRLVIARISGYGQTGPYASRASMDRQAVAMSGIAVLTGDKGGPPIKPGIFIADYTTAVYGAFLVMAAIRARDQATGRGQTVDLGLFEFPFRMTSDWLAEYQITGRKRERQGNGSTAVAPSNAYRCSDGVWVMVACSIDAQWHRLSELIGLPAEAQQRFTKTSSRLAASGEVDALVAAWVAARTSAVVEKSLLASDLPVSRVYDVEDVLADPQFAARHAMTDVDMSGKQLSLPSPAGRLSETPGGVRWHGPALGEHSDHVLEHWLKMDTQTIAQLRRGGVVG